MVESIGLKSVSGDVGVARVATVPPVASAKVPPRETAASADVSSAGGLAKAMAATPPVDTDRVALIKQALANGQYPILPAKIADSLIALRLDWIANDKA